jgi:gliding motility-associated-like protein
LHFYISVITRLIFCFLIFCSATASAQYISRSEPVPYACPAVCAGGRFILKIPQIDNLPAGSIIQALLSNAAGSFATGTQTINATRYSLNQGTNWTNGSYTFTGNITNLYFEITIPGATPPGNGYTIKIKASTGYTSNDLFQCSGGNVITVTPYITPLAQVPQNQQGIGNWIGHVYTWTPTTSGLLNTPALINAQTFFGPANYQGHVIYNPLTFDLNLSANGGIPGTLNNGTSIDCGNSYAQNFSMRLLRQENFTPGFYQMSIQGDDGIRLSIDGGATWILNSFIEQNYISSLKTTQTNYPNGVCLAGATDLVIEYFQRPSDARLTFTLTPLGISNFQQPDNSTICELDDTFFSIGTATIGYTYQWYVNQNGAGTFTPIVNGGIYSGATTGTLSLTAVSSSNDNNQYYCEITGPCGPSVNSSTAILNVSASPILTQQPLDQAYCQGQDISFNVVAGNNNTYQWLVSNDGGNNFTPLIDIPPYSGTSTNTLLINSPTANMVGLVFYCIVSGCNNAVNSNEVEIITGTQLSIVQEPISQTVCEGQPINYNITVSGNPNFQWQINTSGSFVDLVNGAEFSGTQTSNLTILNADFSQDGFAVRCILTGGCFGPVISQQATITVRQAPSINLQPIDVQKCVGENAIFIVNATGSGIQYQWQMSTDNGVTFSPLVNSPQISGATAATLTFNTITTTQNGIVLNCLISGNCLPTLTTENVVLTVNDLPIFVSQPQGLTACEGSSIQFSAQTQNSSGFQWSMSLDNGITFALLNNGNGITGTNSNSITINPVSLNLQGAQFQLQLEGCGNAINSNTATLAITPLPKINSLSAPPAVCIGENAIWSVTTSNADTFNWFLNTGNGYQLIENGNGISGAYTNTLVINNINSSLHLGEIICVAGGTCFPADTSEKAVLFIKGVPIILSEPISTPTCSGQTILLPVATSGEDLDYQWEIRNPLGEFDTLANTSDLQGTETATLQLQANNEINGIVVRCVITGCGAEAITDTIRINVLQDDEVYIPSAFTPDGDKINPVFQLYTEGEPLVEASIYSRWGELIYSWKDKTDGWDGTFNGLEVQEGVYVYRIIVNTACSKKTRMGTITLYR